MIELSLVVIGNFDSSFIVFDRASVDSNFSLVMGLR